MPLSRDEVETTLLAWEAILCNGRSVVSDDVVAIWVAILEDERVTEDEYRRATVVVAKAARFGLPKPADLIDAVAAIRAADRAADRPRFAMARDAEGRELPRPVPIGEIDPHGRWVAPGAPALPPPPKALPVPLTEAAMRAKLRAMTPIGRRAFATLIRAEGGDPTREVAAIREIEAEEDKEAAASASRRDEERTARVRDQAAAMRGERKAPPEARSLARSGGHG